MTEGKRPTVLRVELPGVVSWSRPRRARGGVRYPRSYVRARDAWGLLVALAVREARWRPPPDARYRVKVGVAGGGRRDLDRVCTAVLDALQAGGGVRDDCLVDALTAARRRPARRQPPATVVEVAVLARTGATPCDPWSVPARVGATPKENRHAR
jgi:hypothetical protein